MDCDSVACCAAAPAVATTAAIPSATAVSACILRPPPNSRLRWHSPPGRRTVASGAPALGVLRTVRGHQGGRLMIESGGEIIELRHCQEHPHLFCQGVDFCRYSLLAARMRQPP